MEDVLARILKDSTKTPVLRQSCLDTQEFMANQLGLMRAPSFEIREKCLAVLQLALESKNNKLMSHALSGFQKLVWDNAHSPFETDDEERWLPCQLLKAISSLPQLPEDTQVAILKILLQLAGASGWHLSTDFVLQLISLCMELYRHGNIGVRTAALATASQTLQCFCCAAQESDIGDEGYGQDDSEDEEYNLIDSVVEEILPILEFLTEQIKLCNSAQNKYLPSFLLQCALSTISGLKSEIYRSQKILDFTWQKLCPLLVALLGSPRTDKNIVSSQKSSLQENAELGRGSGCLATAPSCHSSEAKTVYSIANELVRLVGTVGSLRPVLESLFHRMLLYFPPQHRAEALKTIKELMKKPENLLQFAGPSLYDNNNSATTRSTDLDLMRILMDCLRECCHSNDNIVCYLSVSCIATVLKSLHSITTGSGISEELSNQINNMYRNLEDADYKGIQSTERWERKLQNYNSEDKPEMNECIHLIVKEEEVNGNVTENVACENQCEEMEGNFTESLDKQNENVSIDLPDLNSNEDEAKEIHSDDCNSEAKEESVCVDKPNAFDSGPEKENKVEVEIVESDNSSSTTEGPEEGFDDDDENLDFDKELDEHQRILEEEEAARREKVPRTLLGKEDAGRTERERLERLCEARIEFALQERNNAKQFVKALQTFLPNILAVRSSIEADQAIQEFSSKYCEDLWKLQHDVSVNTEDGMPHITILNADGIYLATYSALLLNLKLLRQNFYQNPTESIPLTEQEFVDEVHGTGVLVYLSATWLAELYQQILTTNILENAGYCPTSTDNSALINLLTGLQFGAEPGWIINVSDVDGLGTSLPGGKNLSDYRRLERAVSPAPASPVVDAGMKFARRVLTGCWDTILEVLSVLLNGTNSCGITGTLGLLLGTEGAKEEHRRARDAIADSMDGLQMAANLCNVLGLQSRCGGVFAQLASASCPLPQDGKHSQSSTSEQRKLKKPTLLGSNKSFRLHTSHILSMDVILSRGLELGSHNPDCWKHVFRCCCYVLELENMYFSSHNQTAVSRLPVQMLNQLERKPAVEDNNLFLPPLPEASEDYVETSSMPGTPLAPTINVAELLMQGSPSKTNSGIIKGIHLQQIIEGVSQLVDRLFEDAANKLNLSALIGFLIELCAASQNQLFSQYYKTSNQLPSNRSNVLLLYHLGDVMLRCARGGRPLIHIMKAWSIAAPHFVEAACHKDRIISKHAVTTIHDIVSALLSTHTELPYFHFNEALFKPFENLLCLELCDNDVQEQIISSICEFVEGCTTDIHSGWRPLFGALQAVQISGVINNIPMAETEKEQARHLRVVLDVFEAFLGTNNVLVFAYAAVDCLLCLLKHVRGPAELQDNNNEEYIVAENLDSGGIPLDLCLAALKYLERCAAILASTYKMPACPVFNSANRIQLRKEPQCIDPIIPNMQIVYFKAENDTEIKAASNPENEMSAFLDTSGVISLDEMDHPTGVLRVWFLLLEGLAGAVATCPRKYQPHTMEMLFSMLHGLKEIPGPSFGIYCVNHLLLPMIQGWLRRTSRIYRGWDNFASNFKQCCGLSTDLVVDYISSVSEKEELSRTNGINLMLHQLLLVLTECIAQPTETISRLGCSCIRHIIISCGPVLTEELWKTVCTSLHRACAISLCSVQQLMVCFHTDSENFYGDIGQVKVAVRRDCTLQESERLQQLAHQVFLLDCQRMENDEQKFVADIEEERSYIFLLHPPNTDHIAPTDTCIIRVPFRNLVVGLLSHQILLQTIGTLLLQGTSHILPGLAALLSHSTPFTNSTKKKSDESLLPGMLSSIPAEQLNLLLQCLLESFITACDFDVRPGLKFLIQKVAQTDVAANLYKQTGISWTICALVLFELSLNTKDISMDLVNQIVYDTLEDTDKQGDKNADSLERANRKTILEKDSSPFQKLKDLFNELCKTYTEMALDKDGQITAVDKISDQPIFFLTTQPDEFQDIFHNSKKVSINQNSEEINECPRTQFIKQDSINSTDSEDISYESKDKVYTVATERTIDNLVCEYKKRKTQHTMPPSSKEKSRKKQSSEEKNSPSDEIDVQCRTSIMKDGEARLQVWSQLIRSVLDLHLSLPEHLFKSLLPVIFPGLCSLTISVVDIDLKLIVSEWMHRMAVCSGFAKEQRTFSEL